jgi:membrane protease YdiL (CAAX protease family)
VTRWAPFFALTGVVVVLVLGLARLSSGALREDGATKPTAGNSEPGEPDEALGEPTTPGSPGPQAGRASHRPRPPAGGGPQGPSPPVEPADEPPGDPAVAARPAAQRAEEERAQTDQEPVQLSTEMLLANVALTQGLVGIAIGAGLWYFEIPLGAIGLAADPWVAGLPAVGLGVGFGLVLWTGNEAAAGIADAVGAGYDEAMRSMLAPATHGGWAVLLGLVLPTVAVVEELLFRGALIGVPAAGLDISPWLLAVVSSAAFALGHGAQGRVGIAVTGLLGFVLAAGYVVSGSLVVVVVAHYLVNALEFVVHEALGVDRLV